MWAEDAAGEIAYDATATTGRGRQLRPRAHPPRRRLAYYCQETKTGDDYILDPEVYEFSVDEEGLIAGEPAYVFLNTNYHKRIIEAHKVEPGHRRAGWQDRIRAVPLDRGGGARPDVRRPSGLPWRVRG